MSCCRIASACGVFLFALQSAWGAPPDSQERAARKACLLGDVVKGTEILADLYLDTKDPTHIYNQGRCYEQNGQNEQAILRFREYLRKVERLPAADAAAVEKKITELEQRDRSGSASPVATPPLATAVAPTPAESLPSSSSPTAVTPAAHPLQIGQPSPTPTPQKSTPVYKSWWFWSGVGVVVAGTVVSTVLVMSRSGEQHSPPCAPSGVTCVP